MFKWLIRIFFPYRLVERYEDMGAILDAHNALIEKTNTVRDYLPPKYLLARYNAIQESEERAIAAYWRNKAGKYDKWCKRPTTSEINTMCDIVEDKTQEEPPEELAATQPAEAVPVIETPPTDAQTPETSEEQPAEVVSAESTETFEPPKEDVVEIHIQPIREGRL